MGAAAFAWSVLFAAAHACWAIGGTAFLSAAMVADGRERWDRDPRGSAVSWAILTLLFVCAGLLPLALAWPGGVVGRRAMERVAVAVGYAGMASLIGLGHLTGEPGLAVLGGGGPGSRRLGDEDADGAGEGDGLVLGDQGVAVGYLDQPAPGKRSARRRPWAGGMTRSSAAQTTSAGRSNRGSRSATASISRASTARM